MNIALWVVQVVLGAFFLFSGGMKVFAFDKYRAMLEARSKGKELGFSQGFLTFIGVCELAGGLGLILPMALRILPVLTPLAALGLAIIMVGATAFHLRRKEAPAMPVVLLVLLGFVIFGRGFSPTSV